MSRRLSGAERAQAKVDRHNAKTWTCLWPGCPQSGLRVTYVPPVDPVQELERHHAQAMADGTHKPVPSRLTTHTTEQRTAA